MNGDTPLNRRRFLGISASTLTVAYAGCIQDNSAEEAGARPDQFQYDSENTGVAHAAAPSKPTIDRKTRLPDRILGLSATSDRLFVAAHGTLYSLNQDDGSQVWETTVGHAIHRAPAVVENTAYVPVWNGAPGEDRGVVAINVADGSEQWRAIPGVDVASAPTVAGDTLYVGTSFGDTELIALDTADGTVRWRFEAGEGIPTPAVSTETVYIGGGETNAVYAIDAQTGEQLWKTETAANMTISPTVVNETVYVPDKKGTLYAFRTSDGTEQWRVQFESVFDATRQHSMSSAAATTEAVYVQTYEFIAAVNADGTQKWKRTDVDSALNAPVVADETILTTADHAYCLETATGERRWKQNIAEKVNTDTVSKGADCEPILTNETVFLGTNAGDVYAVTN
jgi:outer membrane protein assembly factor BamB